ncbi:MAG: hypothetical protein ACRD19_03470, partial [Terriglobia bacterium]
GRFSAGRANSALVSTILLNVKPAVAREQQGHGNQRSDYMKKLTALLCATVLSGAALGMAKAPPKPADFSGTWLLDLSQTKDMPQGLESYSMVVRQDPQALKVNTSLKGDVKEGMSGVNPNGSGGPNGSGYPGGSRGGIHGGGMGGMGRMGGMGGMGRMGVPGGESPMGEGMPGSGMPGGGSGGQAGGSRRQGRSHDTSGAFVFYPASATYSLDGTPSSAQFGGPMHGDASLKANWAKNGQELKMALDGNPYSSPGGGSLELKDQWKLSKDGQSLLVDRTVRAGRSSNTVHLVFHRQTTGSSHSGS